jgi:hypothetical protein
MTKLKFFTLIFFVLFISVFPKKYASSQYFKSSNCGGKHNYLYWYHLGRNENRCKSHGTVTLYTEPLTTPSIQSFIRAFIGREIRWENTMGGQRNVDSRWWGNLASDIILPRMLRQKPVSPTVLPKGRKCRPQNSKGTKKCSLGSEISG